MTRRLTVSAVVRAIREDCHPLSGPVRDVLGGQLVGPPELWVASAELWVQEDGSRVSRAFPNGALVHPGRLGRWRIRRAVASWWARAQCEDEGCGHHGTRHVCLNTRTGGVQ